MSRSAFDMIFSNRTLAAASVALLAVSAVGCDIDPSEYEYGFILTGLEFELYSEDVGIHPSLDVLLDENNPFIKYGIDPNGQAKFDILEAGGNVAGFYAWASVLASAPTGDAQYYSALKLRDIFRTGEASEEDLPKIRLMAIRGFQAALDYFPESVIFLESGRDINNDGEITDDELSTIRVATLCYKEIEALGGVVKGDWILVQLANGSTEAVRSSPLDPPRPDPGGNDDD